MSVCVGIGTLFLILIFGLDVAGIVTEYWMIPVVNSSPVIQPHGSLFKLCFKVSSSEACSGYITVTKDFLNGMYNITILKLIHL